MSEPPAFGPLRGTIQANGIEFAYLEMGQGPLVLCLHGFPDRAESFEPLLVSLAAAGFRGVAPSMRGYAPSGFAPDGDYTLRALAQDVIALIDQFGAQQAAVVGHDWGAIAAYAACGLRADRISKLVTAGVPHLRRMMLRPSFDQLMRSKHLFKFQSFRAEREVGRNNFDALRKGISRVSPGWSFEDTDWWAAVRTEFSQTGRLTAALDYYRALRRMFVDVELWRLATAPVTVPTRMIYGARDGSVGTEMFDKQDHLFAGGMEAVGMETGHYMHKEKPEEFSRLVVEFFRM